MASARLASIGCRTAVLFFCAAPVACERLSQDGIEGVGTSPNASILPAPLASAPPLSVEAPASVDGGTERGPTDAAARAMAATDSRRFLATAFRVDQPLESEVVPIKDQPGLSLEGEWHLWDLPGPAKVPEANPAGIDAARKAAALSFSVDLAAQGRLRVGLRSRAFPLLRGTELRARIENYGHVLVWPAAQKYRPLPVGAVRTLFDERRADAIPLFEPQITGPTEGPRRLGRATRRWEVATRHGRLTLDTMHAPSAGDGAVLFCRLLTELIAADPAAAPCKPEALVVRAQYAWQGGTSLLFEVTSQTERMEIPNSALTIPPPGAAYESHALPSPPTGAILTREELAALRQRPTEAPGRLGSTLGEGLAAQNGTDQLRYLLLDGIPVAWVGPNREERIVGPLRGRYSVQWRTFLGDAIEPAKVIEIPGRVSLGVQPDAGPR